MVERPDMGTNEQVMSWTMDTYSQQVGSPVPEIVTGKPLVLGGPSAGLPEPGNLILVIIGYAARVFRRRYHS
jgi:glutamate dehydrogenase (NAD(P)+)